MSRPFLALGVQPKLVDSRSLGAGRVVQLWVFDDRRRWVVRDRRGLIAMTPMI